jgi:DNA replication terminus site-binding protein
MTEHSTFSTYDFKLELARLNEVLAELRHFLYEETTLEMAHTFTLPAVKKEDANMRQLGLTRLRKDEEAGFDIPLDAPFAVEHLSGHEAMVKAIGHYQCIHAANNESTRFSKRLPGILCVRTSGERQLVDLVNRVNIQKDHLATVIQGLAEDADTRFELVHQSEPGFMHSMATRQISFLHQDPLISASFVWEHKNAIQRFTKAEVIKKIENSLKFGKAQRNTYETQAGFELYVQQELRTIGGYADNAVFHSVRPLPASPVAKLRIDKEHPNPESAEKTKRIGILCHSPILVINAGAPRRFTPLKHYPGRPPTRYGEPVIRRLHLYEKPA